MNSIQDQCYQSLRRYIGHVVRLGYKMTGEFTIFPACLNIFHTEMYHSYISKFEMQCHFLSSPQLAKLKQMHRFSCVVGLVVVVSVAA